MDCKKNLEKEIPTYEEKQKLFTDIQIYAMTGCLGATIIAILISYFLSNSMISPALVLGVSICLVLIILYTFFVKIEVSVYDDKLTIKSIRTRIIPFKAIQSSEVSTIDKFDLIQGYALKNSFKKIKYVCMGKDDGITIITKDKFCIFVSSDNPENIINQIKIEKTD